MSWRPTATHSALRRRAEMLRAARAFFERRAVMEVETPILSAAAVSDPQIESLATRVSGIPYPMYLCPSPEFAMKRLLAAGSGDVYQICKVFRDAERGRWHNPEFTMLEWYRIGFDDAELMDEVEELVGHLLTSTRAVQPADRLSYGAAMRRYAGIDVIKAGDTELRDAAIRHGIDCETPLERDAKLDLLMGLVVGPQLGRGRPCFVCDYPASQAALARLKPGTPRVAARFELYVDGIELANGFHELVQPQEQRARFLHDLKQRAERGHIQAPLDENLLAALEHGMPECAGVAVGFDRLVAIALGADKLTDALTFSIDNA